MCLFIHLCKSKMGTARVGVLGRESVNALCLGLMHQICNTFGGRKRGGVHELGNTAPQFVDWQLVLGWMTRTLIEGYLNSLKV